MGWRRNFPISQTSGSAYAKTKILVQNVSTGISQDTRTLINHGVGFSLTTKYNFISKAIQCLSPLRRIPLFSYLI